jgi:peptidoglycan LD-endopeptidase CwlK
MPMGKHYGAFAGGFAKSFTEMMKLYLMQQHYEALNKHYAAQEALWAQRGQGKGFPAGTYEAGAAAGRAWDAGGGGGGAVTGKFWTPENQQHAYNVLMSSGKFSEYGAAGAVARMTREAPDGPTSVNPKSGAFGIAQWLGDRKTPIAGNTNFDDQLKYYAGSDLERPEQARAKEQFKNASTAEEGSYAAMHFERAGGYQESGGRSDVLLNSTPTASVYATVHGGGGGGGAPTEVAATTQDRTGYVRQDGGNTGPNGIYANIPVKDSKGRDQLPMFLRWNPDPVGNEASNLKQLSPDMQKVIARARADNPDLKFVLGNGKRSAADQDWAKSVGWSQVGSKDGGDASVHMKGNAADLWALDDQGRVTFDPGAQAKVTAAIKAAAQKEGVKINAGDDWRHPDKPHFELASPKTTTAAAPTKGPDKGKVAQAAPEGPPVLHGDGSYQVAGDTGIALTPEEAEKARKDLEAHRASPDVDTDAGPGSSGGPGLPLTPASRGPTGDPASAMEEANTAARLVGKDPLPIGPPIEKPIPIGGGAGNVLEAPTGAPPIPIGGGAGNVLEAPTGTPTPIPPIGGGTGNVQEAPTGTPAGPTPQMGPEGPGRTELPPEWSHMPYPGQTDPKGVYAPKPTARTPATEANKPTRNAQPVSASQPTRQAIPSNPAGNTPGFVQITAPNSDPTARNRPQMTALDLSHLWGPNPPLPQQTPAPAAPAPRPDDWSSAVGAPDMSDVDFTGAAKGGPIRRFSKGGIPSRPMMRFQGGGASNTVAWTGPTSYPNMDMVNQVRQAMNTLVPLSSISGAGSPAYAALTPEQQQWYNQQSQLVMDRPSGATPSFMLDQWQSQLNPNYPQATLTTPTASATPVTPTPPPVTPPTAQTIVSPAASTTTTDPTTTTTTGAPSLPNSVTAKSYDPNVDQQTGAAFSNTSNQGGTDYSVGTDDLLKQNNQGQISGSRKGGPIKRFAKGGGIPSRPMTRFAAGGGAAASTLLSPDYSGPIAGGGWAGTPYADMAPNQQAWATTQQNLLSQEKANANNPAWSGWAQLSGTPAAIWPTAAPAAPTPLNEPAPTPSTIVSPSASSTITDPTTTTTTGAPGLPNSIQANSYDPNVDAQTGAGFANTSNVGGTDYSVGTDDLLKTNDQNQISGSRKGGPITQRVNRYDDGGGVSPSAAGMPPGLGGQAQQIPPIYFNPATYAGAGAPVGKGITQNSATTFTAGAIPSLPMARGGAVAFDDGGVADPDSTAEDMQVDRDDALINQSLDSAPAEGGAAPLTYFTPADVMQPPTTPPSNVSPMTPEITDGQGNPSRGLIAAIGDGLHWLGDHLGLVGGAQAHPAIASDPQTQNNRSNFAQGNNVGGMDHDAHRQIATMIDPKGTLDDAERNIAVMEGSYRFLLSQGDTQNASKMAASILQYSVQTSQQFAEEAAKQLYDGNLQGAADAINHASDAIPDGRLTHVTLNKDGTAIVTAKGMDGRTLWQHHGSAEAILQYATNRGRTGQMQWDALEAQAAKYDPTFRDMAKNRALNANAQAKEDAAEASAERVAGAVGGNTLQPVTRVGNAAPSPALPGPGAPAAASPSPVAPVATPISAPTAGASPSPDSRGAAAPATAPQGADSNASVTPPRPTPDTTTPASEAPTPEAPTPEAQNVSFDDIVNRINNQETQANNSDLARIRGNYFTPEGNILYGGQEYARPPAPNVAGLKPAEQRQALQAYAQGPLAQYNAMLKANQDAFNKEVSENRDLRSKQFQTLRDQAGRQFTEGQANRRTQAQIDAAALAEKNRQADEATKEQQKQTWETTKPLSHEELTKTFAEHPPVSYLAASPDTAVYKSDGSLDENASAKALGAKFDLNDRGGLKRLDTLNTALWNTQAYNTHVGPQELGTILNNMASNTYGFRAAKGTIDRGDGIPLRQVEVFRGPVGKGTPTRLLIPADDFDAVSGIQQDWQQAHAAPSAPTSPGAPAAPAPASPAIPRTPYKPLVQSRPGEESGLRLPQWVPPNQIPPEQKQLYPEWNR